MATRLLTHIVVHERDDECDFSCPRCGKVIVTTSRRQMREYGRATLTVLYHIEDEHREAGARA